MAIIVKIIGGLGNQMFQYAAAMGLAKRLGCEVLLDLSAFEDYKANPYELDRLQVPQTLAASGQLGRPARRSRGSWFARRKPGNGGWSEAAGGGYYSEPHFHFDEGFFQTSQQDVLIDGFFQSPLYFADCEDMIRERFRPFEPFGAAAQAWADHIGASGRSVSLHVRRGDYVSNPKAAAVHNSIGQGYYQRAIGLVRRMFGEDVDFFLFSDDPDFVGEAFADLPRAQVVRTDPERRWEDMFLMARCQHHIIANSSYSWWGAWLNPSPDKVVIAPGQWFTRQRMATTNVMDLYPEGWIILK